MTCKFCSVKEAAERLDATEDQIENLLRKGMLREFRDGPHRLLRTADIGAIVMARNRRLERQGQPPMAPTPRSSPAKRQNRPQGPPGPGRVAKPAIRLPHSATGAPPSAHHGAARPKTVAETPKRTAGPGRAACRARSVRSSRSSALPEGPRARTRRVDPEVRTQYQTLSLREWFWIGLIQDNPVAIILLCGFVLLMLSALVAGAYALKDVL